MLELLEKIDLEVAYLPYFTEARIGKVDYHLADETLVLNIEIPQALPYGVYRELIKKLGRHTLTSIQLEIQSQSSALDFLNLSSYINDAVHTHNFTILKDAGYNYADNTLKILCIDLEHQSKVAALCERLDLVMQSFGIHLEYLPLVKEIVAPEIEEVKAAPKQAPVERQSGNTFTKRLSKKDQYNLVPLSVLTEEATNVSVVGRIFNVEVRETRTGKFIAKYSISDGEFAIFVNAFADTEDEILKKGKTFRFYGNYTYDARFARDYIFRMEMFEEVGDLFVRHDNYEEKRVEFHMHTNYSEMDGISQASEYLDQAFKWGHPGMVITDHNCVQSFPKAYNALKGFRKAYPEQEFTLGYGLEMNMVPDKLNIVRSPHNQDIQSSTYVVFDIETTGLSARYDHIIEFGAVLIENGRTVDKMQMFIKPPVAISTFTTELTSITQMDVNSAPVWEDAVDTILDFIQDRILVAHNASFDIDFLQEKLRVLGRPALDNTVIDTLDLSRAILEDRRSYRLGAIARALKINYDEQVAHRADYDAEVLCLVFLEMLRHERIEALSTVNELDSLNDDKSFSKNRPVHLNVVAKNQEGLKSLYKLVTLSHTKYLSYDSTAQSRIVKEAIVPLRENLLLGAGCLNSEVFEIAANKSQSALEEAISFYDYIEIMPLNYYEPAITRGMISNQDHLKNIIMNIIHTAKGLNKIVIGVANVHYNHPRQKLMRDVYISAQGLGGARHPLFMYDAKKRAEFIAPDQHFKTTKEMMDDFAYMGDALAYELVIASPKALLASIDSKIEPVPSKLYTPTLENSDELLTDIVYETAHGIYGNPLPEIVEARIKRELKSILGHGYGVIYYISHLLVGRSLEDGYLVGSRGSVGSSLVATMAKITEVNPLAPHYVCTNCHYNEFFLNGEVSSGFDLTPKDCPKCSHSMLCDGQDIPFETFLGFEGDKVPDIDLNFSGEYQDKAHAYTKEIFGEDYVFRAGTISTVAEKTAYGYVLGYNEDHNNTLSSQAWNSYLANGSEGVKRTTGQHPGGIIVVPDDKEVHDFTPIQYPANNRESAWYTTHFEFHDIDDNVLKLDILGHVDPTAMKLLEKYTGVDINTVPLNDAKVLSLFGSIEALNVDERHYTELTGGLGLPEFGTPFVRQMLEETKPNKFSDLVQISGLSHGTDVWRNNAQDLIKEGLTLEEVIGCRDDIMVYLMQAGLPNKVAFDIMESVRKGKGLRPEWIQIMRDNKVPQWYIDSCLKIKYMFPKAHAVAYVMMAVRVAWFKVYYPAAYYAVYFTLRSNAYELESMSQDIHVIQKRLNGINAAMRDFQKAHEVPSKDKLLVDTLEVCIELNSRGYRVGKLDLMKSHATDWIVDPNDPKAIIPPFTAVDGLGAGVANGVIKARQEREFMSKRDLITRAGISAALVKKLDDLQVTSHLDDSNQMSLF